MSKNKFAKYKITDTDIDKKIIGKHVTVEKVKAKGGPGGGRKLQKPKAPAWFIEFRDEQRAFNKQQLKFNKTIVNRLDRVIKVNNLKE